MEIGVRYMNTYLAKLLRKHGKKLKLGRYEYRKLNERIIMQF